MRSLSATIIVLGGLCCLPFHASGSPPSGGVSAGVEGIGNHWPSGTPGILWWINERNAVEAIASFSYDHSLEHDSRYYDHDVALEVAWLRSLHHRSGMRAGFRLGLDYHEFFIHSETYNERDYSVAVSGGPDLEYFLPILPRISLGAHAVVRVKFREAGWGTSVAHNYHEKTYVEILGQLLSIRYYF